MQAVDLGGQLVAHDRGASPSRTTSAYVGRLAGEAPRSSSVSAASSSRVDEQAVDPVQEVVAVVPATGHVAGSASSALEDLLDHDLGAAGRVARAGRGSPRDRAGRRRGRRAARRRVPSRDQLEDQRVGVGEDLGVLDAQADQRVDVEEAAVVELLARPSASTPGGSSAAARSSVERVGVGVERRRPRRRPRAATAVVGVGRARASRSREHLLVAVALGHAPRRSVSRAGGQARRRPSAMLGELGRAGASRRRAREQLVERARARPAARARGSATTKRAARRGRRAARRPRAPGRSGRRARARAP